MAHVSLYIDNDNLFKITGLQNKASAVYPSNATVTAQVYEGLPGTLGATVGSAVTLAYVAASDGDYQGTMDEEPAALLGSNDWYVVVIDAEVPGDLKGHWEIPAQAVIRTS